MSLDGGFEEMGQFWLAGDGDAEHALPGKMTVDHAGSATVEVFSPMASVTGSLLDGDLRNAPSIRILGVTETNKAVTIDHARFASHGRRIMGVQSGVRRMDFWSDELLTGRHYWEHEEIQFDRVLLDIEHAFEWFGLSGLQGKGYSLKTPWKMTVNYEQPPPIPFRLSNGVIGKVWFGVTNFIQPAPWSTTLELEQMCSISLNSYHTCWYLDDVKELSLVFQSFFALVTNSPACLTGVSASLIHDPQKESHAEDAIVKLFYSPYREDTPEHRTLHPNEMLFVYEDVHGMFGEIMANWLQYWRSAEYAIRASMRSRYGRLILDDHLRILTQALEITVGKDIGDKENFIDLVRHLTKTCWAEWDDDLDIDAFSEAVLKYRNWFVHFDRKRERPRVDVDYGEVATICRNLGAMLDIYMLSKCVPGNISYRDLITEKGDLKWLLKKRLQLHPKHRR